MSETLGTTPELIAPSTAPGLYMEREMRILKLVNVFTMYRLLGKPFEAQLRAAERELLNFHVDYGRVAAFADLAA